MALHFNCCPSELDSEQVLDYLHFCQHQHKTPSASFFKHTVYGLRAVYRLKGMNDKRIVLPSVPVAQVHSNIKKYLQDWDKNINFMECKARKNIRRNYSQVFS